MSLSLKNISSWNIEGKPFYDNIFPKIYEIKEIIEKYSSINNKESEDELNIFCIQGLYGYKNGYIGNVFSQLFYALSTSMNPFYLSSVVNLLVHTNSNDFELISLILFPFKFLIIFHNHL